MKLVIIEGPGKRDTLKKYLGEDYEVVATKGHVRDLPVKEIGIDFSHDFEPKYEVMADKKTIITDLKKKAEKSEKVLLATDPDREGEAISWHIASLLGFKPEDKCRIEFNEISEHVVKESVMKPREIDMDLVDAQQARRVLDRIVGYKVSPIICKKIKPKLSAGRVQSVALKLVVDRENEIKNFKPEEYWNFIANLKKDNNSLVFKSALEKANGKKIKLACKEEVDAVTKELDDQKFVVSDVKKTSSKVHPSAQFTTSTMQQDALNKLGMDLSRTSRTAQQLYEGIDLPSEGKVAFITYIRTDSVRVSPEAQAKARDYISKNYGDNFVPTKPNFYSSKQNAQDAHEAIRPISVARTPESVKDKISPDCFRLYKLIYERFVASQMVEAIYNNLTVLIDAGKYQFKTSGKTLAFAGYTAVYKNYDENEQNDNAKDEKIPSLEKGEDLNLVSLTPEQKFTKPPQRLTEASLVKMMEEKGIGRPATYAPTITTLSSREYVKKDGRFLIPTELGNVVTKYMEENFKSIMDVAFTAKMESSLDKIADGGHRWQELIEGFWKNFSPYLKRADASSVKMKVKAEETDIVCEKCGGKMVIREGKFGKFLGCSNFPKCNNIQKLSPDKPKAPLKAICKCPICGKDVVARRSKRGKLFYGCSGYPTCKFVSWDKPTGDKCPKCGAHLVISGSKENETVKCSNQECDFKK